MPHVIGQSPYGVAWQQDDGSVLTMPHDFAPPDTTIATQTGPGPGSPVPDLAFEQIGATPQTGPTPPPAPPDPNAIDMEALDVNGDPGGAIDPTTSRLMGQTGLAPPAGGLANPYPADANGIDPTDITDVNAPDEPEGGIPPVGDEPDAIGGGAIPPAVAPIGDALLTPEEGGSAATEPYQSPEQQAINAERALGVNAANRADEEARLLHERQVKFDDLTAQQAQADAKIAEHRAAVEQQYDVARQKFVQFDMTPEEKTGGGAIIAMIFGAIGNVLMRNYGGANPVIAILDKKAEAAARARVAQQSKLGQVVDMAKSDVDHIGAVSRDSDAHFYGVKAAILSSYAQQIEARAADFQAPEELLKAQQAIAGIQASYQTAAQKAADAAMKTAQEQMKIQIDAQKAIDQREHDIRSDKNTAYGIASTAKTAAARLKFDSGQAAIGNDQWERDYQARIKKIDADIKNGDAVKVPALTEARHALEEDHKRSVGVIPRGVDAAGRPVFGEFLQAPVPVGPDGPVLGPDGKPAGEIIKGPLGVDVQRLPLRAPDEQRATALANKVAATRKMITIVDRVIRLREKYGWSSTLIQSPEFREMQANYSQGILTKKEIDGLGVLSGPDETIEKKTFGTNDPTEVRDPLPGLRESRRLILQGLNADLRGVGGYTGEDFDVPDISDDTLGKKADESPAGQSVREATEASRAGGKVRAPGPLGYAGASFTFDSRPKNDPYAFPPGVEDRVTPLVINAKRGDESALAGVAKLTRDPVFGAGVQALVAREGVDLSKYLTPEEVAVIADIKENAPIYRDTSLDPAIDEAKRLGVDTDVIPGVRRSQYGVGTGGAAKGKEQAVYPLVKALPKAGAK